MGRPSALRPFGCPPTSVTMRTATIAILGSPFACWAMYGCLTLLGIGAMPAAVAAIVWGVLWLAIVHLGRNASLLRRRRSMRGRGVPGGRGVWTGAVLSSLFLPLPLYLLTALADRTQLAPVAVALPVLALLALPAPTALWWMTLWPVAQRDEEVLRPIGWRRYTPHASSASIPPRGGTRPRD